MSVEERTDEELARACAAVMLERDAASRRLGIVIEDAQPGRARIAMTITEEMVNGHAIAHGGVTFTLADSAFAFACNSRNVPNVALQASISYLGAVHLGDRLVADAREESSSQGRTAVYDVRVTRNGDQLVALFRGVSYRIKGTVLEGAGTAR